ncbi:MAG: hypothetical protein PSV22_14365 [Pseudolabrys sp.]|nr:hypothetical protein [Pseudolabrys sp.]
MMGTIRLLFVAALVLLSLVACTSTPSRQWASARDALTIAQDTVLELRKVDAISDADLVAADRLVQPARKALAVAETQLPEGGKTFDEWMAVVRATLVKIAEMEQDRLASAGEPQP